MLNNLKHMPFGLNGSLLYVCIIFDSHGCGLICHLVVKRNVVLEWNCSEKHSSSFLITKINVFNLQESSWWVLQMYDGKLFDFLLLLWLMQCVILIKKMWWILEIYKIISIFCFQKQTALSEPHWMKDLCRAVKSVICQESWNNGSKNWQIGIH